MKKLLILAGLGLLLAACNSNPKSSNSKNNKDKANAITSESECFASLTQQDSIWLQLKISSNDVTGTLIYHLYEKDKNEGTLQGTLKGDTIIADYTFRSEGQTSVREVAFLLKKGSVIEGFGNMEMQDKKMEFKNRKNIDFSNGITFQKIDCEGIDSVFQIE
ncbi:MAG TPA: hypothetical protein VK084_06460 [Chitinophagaceae bacterium]|nr:hypothetical protein [Chitinophagaceae bacterium]